jgi:hypothetical protein
MNQLINNSNIEQAQGDNSVGIKKSLFTDGANLVKSKSRRKMGHNSRR